MFPGAMPPQLKKKERKLIKLFKKLDVSDQDSILAFAEFLEARQQPEEPSRVSEENVASQQPLPISRPEKESVIKAIKRLSKTYPMVDKENILHPISDLMTAHMLQGKEAVKVIDELELVFLHEYNKLQDSLEGKSEKSN